MPHQPDSAGEPQLACLTNGPQSAGKPESSPPWTEARVIDWLISWLSSRLGLPTEGISIRERFSRYGVTSTIALELTTALSAALQRSLAATSLWDHPTLQMLARHLSVAEGSSVATAPKRWAGNPDDEPIAVIGLACRMPGAEGPEELWRLLKGGVDALSGVPANRWNAAAFYDPDRSAPGKSNALRGGFLKQIDRFDPLAFGISPREAAHMDPQQRLMLELSWEALENAGLPVDALKGVDAGVFFGAMWTEYGQIASGRVVDIGAHTATGQDSSIIAARVSYTLGLEGPSLTVNTACSSSLVAVHLACQSLRSGESSIALAGGVNLMIVPQSTVAMAKFGALSSDGRSKAFDASADGYARGEGAGIVVLKPLSQAMLDGDPIYCVIRGSAVNNDGFSNGLTAPNPKAQERVLRAAYERARIAPSDVHYVEAHGTGTRLGDPIEAKALAAILSQGRPADRPLLLGSIKTNIGHLEAAAGIAGLIKVALAMKHQELPASLHFQTPNPEIDFEALKLRVQREAGPWPGPEEGPLLAGVSSFGFGGTNAHVVLEGQRPLPELLSLSAESLEALRAVAKSFATFSAQSRAPLSALCRAAVRHLSAHPHRLAQTVRSRGELVARLEDFVEGRASAGRSSGERPKQRPRVVFVFSGHGSQWLGMGRTLLRDDPLFRAEIVRWDALLRPLLGESVLELLCAKETDLRVERLDLLQPMLFVLHVALAALWRSWGIEPDAVVGHSLGEVAAAYVAGALDAAAAAQVVHHRSRLLQRVAGRGTMALVDLSLEDAERALEGRRERLSVAGSNARRATTISGDPAALEEALAELAIRGNSFQRIRIDFAAHSPQMAPLLDELRAALEELRPRPAALPMVSTVTGAPIEGQALGADYWARNLREPVRFAQAIERLAGDGYGLFLEISPHPILLHAIGQCLAEGGHEGVVLASLRRGEEERLAMLDALGRLSTLGAAIRWSRVLSPGTEEVTLPAPLHGAPANEASRPDGEASAEGAALVVFSAHSPEALRELASRVAIRIQAQTGVSVRDLSYTAAMRRAHHEHRVAVVARTRQEVVEALEAFTAGERTAELFAERVPPGRPAKLSFVFCGQGPQRARMGCALAEQEPVFRAVLDTCDELYRRLAGWSLWAELSAPGSSSRLQETEIAQPALFALQVALAGLWRSWGIVPAAVIGHSVGEVAAAYVSGAFSLEEAARVVVLRGQIMQRATGLGRMAMVELPATHLEALLAPYTGRLSVAAINGAAETVVAGEASALEEFLASFAGRGPAAPFFRNLGVDYAFHTAQMDPLREAFSAALGEVAVRQTSIPFYSTVTGQRLEGTALGADYWARGIREPVRFAAATDALLEQGLHSFVEIGPHPVLGRSLAQRLEGSGSLVLPSLRREREERTVMLGSLGALYVRGHLVYHAALHGSGGHLIPFPPPPFQRERCWIDPTLTSSKIAMSQTDRNDPPAPVPAMALETGHGNEALVSYYASLSTKTHRWEHLRFGPFPEIIAGYSWVMTWAEPEKHPEAFQRVVAALEEVRQFVFRGIDFSALSNVLDIGCGYSSDLIRISKEHRHLRLHGFNISPDQVELGRRRIREAGLDDRITLFHLDSSKNDFPGQYDLVMAFQVIHHIQDKASVFANISRHLRNGGIGVMAEILSNMSTPIDHAESTAYFVPKEQWAEELARNKLRVVECVDMSREACNFLHDEDFDSTFAQLAGCYDEVTLHHLRGPHQLGLLLAKGLTVYALLRVQKEDYLLRDEILRHNLDVLASPTPYARFTAGARPASERAILPAAPRTTAELTAEALLDAPPEVRNGLCEDHLRRWAAGILHVSSSKLDPQQPLRRFGLDSIMALEMKHHMAKRFSVEIPAVEFLDSLTVADMVTRVIAQIAAAPERSVPQGSTLEGARRWEEGEL